MSDKIAQYVISLGGDDGDLRAAFGRIKSQMRSDVSELESITNKVDLFSAISDNIPKVAAAVDKAKAQITALNAEIKKIEDAGGKAPKALTDALADAEKAAKSATSEFNRQSQQVATLQSSLARAGVDTKNLTAEQTRLAAASKAAADAATVQAAKQTLGLTTLKDIQPLVDKLGVAYTTLQSSGTLSATEIATAQSLLKQRTEDLRGSVSNVSQGFKVFGVDVGSVFDSAIAKALSAGAVIAGLKSAYTTVVDAAHEYENALARIGSVTNTSQQELGALGEGARSVAREVGVDLTESLRGLYEILRSGVPKENAVDVLRVSAEAAVAANVPLTSSVQAANLLISAYGVKVQDLGSAFNVLIQAQKDGGQTLQQFSENAGALLNVARSANFSLVDLSATLQVLVNSGLDAGAATSTLTKIIVQLGNPTVVGNLQALGIEVTGLADTFRQIGEKGLNVNQILDLGLASTKAASSVATLTNNAKALPPELDKLGEAAKKANVEIDALGDTPARIKAKSDAAFKDYFTSVGNAIALDGELRKTNTETLNVFNQFLAAVRKTQDDMPPASERISRLIENFQALSPEAIKSKAALDAAATASAGVGDGAQKAAAQITAAQASLTAYSTDLAKLIGEQQANLTRDIADINARADAQIAALDRSRSAEKETAAETLAIRTKQSTDILKVLTDGEASITAAVNKEIEARTALAGKDAESQRKLEADIAKLKLDEADKLRVLYGALYSFLTEKEQGYAATVEKSANDRIAFNQNVEKILFDIRVGALSSFDQYVAKSQEADRLISLSRQAAERNDADAAQKFGNQAIGIANSLGVAYATNGAQIVSTSQAADEKLRIIKASQDAVNLAFKNQGAAAKDGADATKVQLALVQDKLKELQGKYDDLKSRVEEAIKLSISKEISGIDDAEKALDYVGRDRVVNYKINLSTDAKGNVMQSVDVPLGTLSDGTPFFGGKKYGGFVGSFNRGGYVPQDLQGFATGGPVFQRPNWSKVPGMGDTDSVPALLREGSFVVRKAASSHYGDELMSMLAGGYADGGSVDWRTAIFGRNRSQPLTPQQLADAQKAWSDAAGKLSNTDADTVLAYAQAVLDAAGNSTATDQIFRYVIKDVRRWIDAVEKKPTDAVAVKALLDSANNMGANLPRIDYYGRNTSPTRFDHFPIVFTDWLAEAKAHVAAGAVGFATPVKRAAGGPIGTDTVPAMLTPGEWVIPQHVATMLGGGFLHALNNMNVPRPSLANFSFAPPPMPRAFASGGPVGSVPDRGSLGGVGVGGDLHVHINGAQFDLNNQSDVRRLLYQIDEIRRRTGKKP